MSYEVSVGRYATAMIADAAMPARIRARRVYVSMTFEHDTLDGAKDDKVRQDLLSKTCELFSTTLIVSKKSPALDDFCCLAQCVSDVIVAPDATPVGVASAVLSEVESYIRAEAMPDIKVASLRVTFEKG